MKIFISWSGDSSLKVATVLREWLPSVIQNLKPYVSSEDIDKGARWSTDIAGELNESSYGILSVTKDNINAPWLNFEAGALGKSVDKSKVCPFLFRVKRSEVSGPILQFQSTVFEKEDVFKLLKSINAACNDEGIDEVMLEKSFKVWWPNLEEELNKIAELSVPEVVPSKKSSDKKVVSHGDNYFEGILEEILELSRNNQKLLRDPSSILPEDYFDHLMRRNNRDNKDNREVSFGHPAIEHVVTCFEEIQRFLEVAQDKLKNTPEIDELLVLIDRLAGPIVYISGQLPKSIDRSLSNVIRRTRTNKL